MGLILSNGNYLGILCDFGFTVTNIYVFDGSGTKVWDKQFTELTWPVEVFFEKTDSKFFWMGLEDTGFNLTFGAMLNDGTLLYAWDCDDSID